MADNVAITPGSGATIGADACTVNSVAGVLVPLGKVGFGGNDTWTYVTSAVGLPTNMVQYGGSAVGATNAVHVQPGTGASFAVTGTFWQATQPISAASLPLPTGAATAAKQPALGTAGTASPDVLTVQGIASMTALKVDASATTQPVSGTVTANAGTGTFAVSAASLPLPSGAATAAKQPALGTAGSASADVLTVQGVTSMTALKVDGSAATQPVSNAGTFATQATLQAGTALAGKVSQGADSSTIYNGTTALTPKFAVITASSSGVTTIVPLVTSKKIRVLKLTLSASAAVNVKFQSHVTPTDLTGLFYLAANGGFGLGFTPVGHFETVAGEALDINLSAANAVGGVLTYVEI